jgi:hypothetical protein
VASGCEDSPVTVGKDYQIYVVALPPTVRAAPWASRIVATIVSDTGVPKKGFLVFFSADGGELASGSEPVRTDSNGNAFDTLTIDPDGPGDITVTATSTSLSDSVTVTNGACAANPAPTANFTAGPPVLNTVTGLKEVDLTSTSVDTEDGVITSYEWDCGNATSGGTLATATCSYTPPPVGGTAVSYTITLTVKDDGLGGSAPYSCQKSSSKTNTVSIPPLTP